MSQIITDAFSSYWQQCLVEQTPVVLDEFVLAHIPGLDPDAPIDPASGLPPVDQIVHRHAVDQRGRINNDAVAYSIVMDTTVGDFTFNAMYLINTELNLVGMIVHKGEETKLATDPGSGQTGNSLVKSMLMEYDRAAEASQTVIDASTWQIDYAARLRGMDEDLRRQAMGTFGHAAFYGDGFKLVNDAGLYKVQPGQGYVGGLLVELASEQEVAPSAKPVGLWLDVYRAGSLLSPWVNQVTLTLSTADLVDYVDANGYPHFVTRLATINADDSVTDTRARRTLTLTGDVTGQASFNGPDSIELEVTIEDNSHDHTIENVEGLQEALDGVLPTGSYNPRADAMNNEGGTIGQFIGDLNTLTMGTYVLAKGAGSTNYPDVTAGYMYVETRSIYSADALLQVAWPYEADSAVWFRNYSTNTDSWLPWVKIYDTVHKPTAADVGAMPKSGGAFDAGAKVVFSGSFNGPDDVALDMGNQSIGGVHGLTFSDSSGDASEGILWPKTGITGTDPDLADYDSFRVIDGVVYINANKLYHQGFKQPGTIGSSTEMGANVDLDTMMTPGVWHQSANAEASTDLHYPEASAGSLVIYAAAGIVQEYRVYNSSRVWIRAQYSSGAWTAWAKQYNTQNKPTTADVGAAPLSHTHTAAQGNQDIVAGSYGQVGTYALLHCDAGATSIGATQSGSSLHPADAEGYSSGAMSGTWKQLGYRSVKASDNTGSETTLFIRIA
ncbi:phage tail protein [Aeromonas sp. R10-1]|uniref:phage tail-collar fiber domain-containing protein n=1 Tax=Aeromonas sp. R10-1 TaxID=3138457 RepID=UPI0034A464D3